MWLPVFARKPANGARRRHAALGVETLESRTALSAIARAIVDDAVFQPQSATAAVERTVTREAVIAPSNGVFVSPAVRDGDGFLVHRVRSPYQAGVTQIRLLLPNVLADNAQYRVVYLLPVESGRQNYWGDGLLQAKRLNLPNRLQTIFVAPTFAQLPWYADHSTRLDIRQESHLINAVVPFIDANYPVEATPQGRLLVGFSKSGWGAFSLLLRHPNIFGKAAAWDAPLMMAGPTDYGMAPIFGTQRNFEKYRITRLLRDHAREFQSGHRFVLLGYSAFRSHHQELHALMNRWGISHIYRDGPLRPHDWGGGWLQQAVRLVLSP